MPDESKTRIPHSFAHSAGVGARLPPADHSRLLLDSGGAGSRLDLLFGRRTASRPSLVLYILNTSLYWR
jgi:hypothetical protein